ncbi:DUF2065 domain-containing protein [Luteimonas sp. 8-5]|uniref:DUF2065 domain-containing protein n=1 Tax=Luteimonas sp. 8-5 TaxID=3039387 RepID=UPI0024370EFC|nr:DUF2065 domain-containing protein [Luteimonas sp. 8-5]MDG6347187.1 DUF2065 domain-containing protein [Luteimonas sp. 8-5]
MSELWTALCLMAVFEGLLLFALPDAWRRAAEQLHAMPNRQLRAVGALVVAAGLLSLLFARHLL